MFDSVSPKKKKFLIQYILGPSFENFYFDPLCLIQFFTWHFIFQKFLKKKKKKHPEVANMKIEFNMKSQSEIFKTKIAKMKITTNFKS